MDQVRNPRTTYRVVYVPKYPYVPVESDLPTVGELESWYEIHTYPPKEESLTKRVYRFEAMPEWMQEALHLLDWGTEVHGIGRKVGQTYWIEPVDT